MPTPPDQTPAAASGALGPWGNHDDLGLLAGGVTKLVIIIIEARALGGSGAPGAGAFRTPVDGGARREARYLGQAGRGSRSFQLKYHHLVKQLLMNAYQH